MSGLAALINILRLDVGVHGSTDLTSLPFVGVVRGPMMFASFICRHCALTKHFSWGFYWSVWYYKYITLFKKDMKNHEYTKKSEKYK